MITGCIFQKISLPLDFMHIFFQDFIHVHSPCRGRQPIQPQWHWGQNFDVNRKASSLWSFVASLKKKSLQSLILYTSFHDLINVYSHASGADNPMGQNFNVNRNLLSLQSVTCRFAHFPVHPESFRPESFRP